MIIMSDLRKLLESKECFDYSVPATKEAIEQAESALHLQFAEDYKEYLLEFGSVTFDGHELTGISPNKWQDVVEATKKGRLATDVPDDFYAIERLGIDGMIVWQKNDGTLFLTSPTNGSTLIANSLIDYLAK